MIYSKSKNSPFKIYEFMVTEDHFQHLAGVKYPQGAKLFYEKCLKGDITINDIVPVEKLKLHLLK
ncbi:MAG: hypothetical protein IJ455_02765 [Agathobacter sp.]|nr:hypothetical protein [Agathobacter sp.]